MCSWMFVCFFRLTLGITQLKLYLGPRTLKTEVQQRCKHFCVVRGTISSFFQRNETDSACFIPLFSPCCSTLRLFRSILQWIISAVLLTTLAWNWQWSCLLFAWEQRTRERGRKENAIESPTGTVLVLKAGRNSCITGENREGSDTSLPGPQSPARVTMATQNVRWQRRWKLVFGFTFRENLKATKPVWYEAILFLMSLVWVSKSGA